MQFFSFFIFFLGPFSFFDRLHKLGHKPATNPKKNIYVELGRETIISQPTSLTAFSIWQQQMTEFFNHATKSYITHIIIKLEKEHKWKGVEI